MAKNGVNCLDPKIVASTSWGKSECNFFDVVRVSFWLTHNRPPREAKSEKQLNFLGKWLWLVFENWFLPWNLLGAPSMEPNKVPTMGLEDENFED